MRLKNTPTITKGIVTNMTTKAIIMAKKVTTIHMKVTIMKATTMKGIITKVITMRLMTIRTMATIMTKMVIIQKTTLMKVITMQKKHTITMLMLTKVMTTTTDTLMV